MSQDITKDLELFKKSDDVFKALQNTQFAKKYNPTDLLMIVSKAFQLGMSPFDAVNGGLYAVNGKIEMTAQTMNNLIRAKGHSIQIKKSTNEECVLIGKRADNGDTVESSFTMKDAAQAGLSSKMPWKTYPSDMLFARALSRLARRLYPDVVAGCYVQGEIEPIETNNHVQESIDVTVESVPDGKYLSQEQIDEVWNLVGDDRKWFDKALIDKGYQDISFVEAEKYQGILAFIKDHKSKSLGGTKDVGLGE